MRIKRYCMVCLSLILVVVLSIFPVFASVYDVDPDTEVLDQPQIYYTDNYYPGMLADGRTSYALASYGSYSAYNWNPVLFYLYTLNGSSTSGFKSFSSITPTVSVSTKHVAGEYVASSSVRPLNSASLILNLDNTFFDFQSSDFSYTQESAQADTFYLNGTFRFSLTSLWEIFINSTTNLYAAIDPIGVQLLVDGKAYGEVIPITSYTSPFSSAFSSMAPAIATVTFDDFKVYGVTSAPELIGFRVYVDSAYEGSNYSLGSNMDSVLVTNTNFLSWTSQPTIEFVRESTSSDQDLSNLGQLLQGGLFNGNGVPFLDVVNSFLQDGLFDSYGSSFLANSNSYLSQIFNRLTIPSGFLILSHSGVPVQATDISSFSDVLRYGFLGLGSLLRLDAGYFILSSSGQSVTTTSTTSLVHLVRNGFNGIRSLMVDSNGTPFSSLINSKLVTTNNSLSTVVARLTSILNYSVSDSFSWQNYNLDTHELDAAQTLTGQNQFMNTAFQSIEENLGRLAYVFASDDEIDLRDQSDPGVASFKESFGGGAKAKDIGQMKNTFNDVETMFDTGFSIDDFFSSLNSDSSWLSWFSAETAYALDSTPAVMTVGEDDPYNHQAYQDHLAAVEVIRNRGGAD